MASYTQSIALPQRDVSFDEVADGKRGTEAEERHQPGTSPKPIFCYPTSNAMETFNIGSMRDSMVIRQDSYIMKTLSVLAMIFLPISTISSIFGTQFFTTVTTPGSSSSDGVDKPTFYVSSQFWLLWAVSLPLTLALLLGWRIWIERFQRKTQRATELNRDAEKGDTSLTNSQS